jgi:hypothetical protein
LLFFFLFKKFFSINYIYKIISHNNNNSKVKYHSKSEIQKETSTAKNTLFFFFTDRLVASADGAGGPVAAPLRAGHALAACHGARGARAGNWVFFLFNC